MAQARVPTFDPRYTFETFVAGQGNLETLGALRQIAAEGPMAVEMPLVIWSDSGLGKTHLLHAIGNAVLERNPNVQVRYASAGRPLNASRSRLRSADIALIEDLFCFQPYEGKTSLSAQQRTSLRYLNESLAFLVKKKRRVVLTGDRSPEELRKLGLQLPHTTTEIEIKPADLPTRLAMLKFKATRYLRRELPDDVAQMIAGPVSNPRELEGALNRLRNVSGRLTVGKARERLHDLFAAYERAIIYEPNR